MGPAGSDAAEARAPRPLAVDGGGAQHKTNSRGPRRGLGAQVPRRRGGEAGRGQTPSRGDGPLVLTHDVGGLGNEAAFGFGPSRLRPISAPSASFGPRPLSASAPVGFRPLRLWPASAPARAVTRRGRTTRRGGTTAPRPQGAEAERDRRSRNGPLEPQRGPPPVGRSGRRGRGGEGREALRRSRPPRRRARAPAATSAARPGRGTRPLRRGRGGGARGGARQRRPCAELCGGGRAALGWSLLDDAELKQKTRSASPPRSSASSSIEVLLMQAEAHRASSCCTSSRMLASLWASMMFPWILSFPLMNACMPSSFPLASANISATASVIVTSGFSC
ncbi:unnamed protein product [Prorocentrum cordatum]|uniref:Uncharacterized protein n=1 Tax=Prorocentrum cordatum TaxID=2364126 RepID=A0ABN9TXW2_9DINO|nr:unnamed protein product [Polarella glacialis]